MNGKWREGGKAQERFLGWVRGYWAKPLRGIKGFQRVKEKGAVTREVTGRKVGKAGLSRVFVYKSEPSQLQETLEGNTETDLARWQGWYKTVTVTLGYPVTFVEGSWILLLPWESNSAWAGE